MKVAQRMRNLANDSAFEVLARASELEARGKHIIHMEIGEPDFDTPKHLVDAGVEALQQGYTRYGPAVGLPELREAVARQAGQLRGVDFNPDNVVVTPGAKPIMFFTMLALVQRGDDVIYPNPGFPIFESMIRFCGARPVPMRLLEDRAYHPDLDDLASKITKRTKLIILNSPHNPTGSTLSLRELTDVADIVRQYKSLYILSDEIYKDMVYTGDHHSIASFQGMLERTILLDGLSKSYAMTGWRLGYGIFPEHLQPHMSKLMANSVSCTATFTQMAALQALNGPQDSVKAMVEEFRRRRDIIASGLRNIPGLACPEPEGAFYAFPSIKGTGLSSDAFQRKALEEVGVALLSGKAFGRFGEGCVRLSYATSQDNIRQAMSRLADLVSTK
jgi:aspartate aminotransferase